MQRVLVTGGVAARVGWCNIPHRNHFLVFTSQSPHILCDFYLLLRQILIEEHIAADVVVVGLSKILDSLKYCAVSALSSVTSNC